MVADSIITVEGNCIMNSKIRPFMKLPYDCFTYRLWVDLEPTTDCRWSRAVLVVEDPVKGEEIQLICAVYRAMNPGLGIKWFFGPSLPHGNDVIFPY